MKLTIRTAEDVRAEAERAKQARAAEEARRLLAETDWMVLRAAETGKPVPEDVALARAGARQVIGNREAVTLPRRDDRIEARPR